MVLFRWHLFWSTWCWPFQHKNAKWRSLILCQLKNKSSVSILKSCTLCMCVGCVPCKIVFVPISLLLFMVLHKHAYFTLFGQDSEAVCYIVILLYSIMCAVSLSLLYIVLYHSEYWLYFVFRYLTPYLILLELHVVTSLFLFGHFLELLSLGKLWSRCTSRYYMYC